MSRNKIFFHWVVFVVTILAACRPAVAPVSEELKTGRQVIEAMYNRYNGKWYQNLTFRQETSFYQNDSLQRRQTWYEALSLGKGLIIKFDSLKSGNGLLFLNDTLLSFQDGKIASMQPRVHELLILGFDVYDDFPGNTIQRLGSTGINLDLLHSGKWGDRPAYVVGASEPSDTANQFWIDKERLVFLNLRKFDPRTQAVSNTSFEDYYPLGEAWVAPKVRFMTNGKLRLLEEYFDVLAPDSLSNSVLRPSDFRSAVW